MRYSTTYLCLFENLCPGAPAKIWNAEGCSSLQQMLHLLHVSFFLLFVVSYISPFYPSGTLTKRGQRMPTTCTVALATAAGVTPVWSPKTQRRKLEEKRRRWATDILNVILKWSLHWPVAPHAISFCQNKASHYCQISLFSNRLYSKRRFWITQNSPSS